MVEQLNNDHDWQKLYPFKGEFFTTAQGRIHYLDQGKESDEAIVMVHGNPTWSFFYRDVIQNFSPTIRCVAIDHLGCGLSDSPADESFYTLQQHAERLTLLLKYLGLKKIHLIVHDWGGPIGLLSGLALKEKIQSLVLFNTAAYRSPVIAPSIDFARSIFCSRFLLERLNLFALLATRWTTVRPLDKKTKAGFLAPYEKLNHRIALWRFVQDIPMSEKHPSYRDLCLLEEGLSEFKTLPITVIWGGKDFCFHDYFFKRFKDFFPKADYHYLENAGHYLLEDQKEIILGLLEGHYAKIKPLPIH